MKAAAFIPDSSSWNFEIDSHDIPEAAPGTAVLKVAFCGICGSDLRRFRAFTSSSPPHNAKVSPIAGHEFIGEVIASSDSRIVEVGQFAATNPLVGCGNCVRCKCGEVNLCEKDVEVIGYHRSGGFAEYCSVPLENLVTLPDKPFNKKRVALAEPMAVALNAARNAASFATGSMVVIGDGVIGVLTAWALQNVVAPQIEVTLCGRRPYRMSQANLLGIKTASQASEFPTAVNTVVVAAGTQQGFELGYQMTAKRGKLVFLGYLDETDAGFSASDLNGLVRSEKKIMGSFGYSKDCFRDAVSVLCTDQLDESKIVDQVISLEELPSTLRLLVDKKIDSLKILVDPTLS